MPSSLRDHTAVRPRTRDRQSERPATRDHGEHSLMIPSRTSSLHSRITQPIPSTLNIKPSQRTPKTLTHAYIVCGVGREPSQWVKAPAPAQGKIGHMKGAIGQFWLPEILGSSPRLEQDNEIARALYAAMRVRSHTKRVSVKMANLTRHAFLMMSKFALAETSRIVLTIHLFSSKTHHIHCTVLLCEYGQKQMKSAQRPSVICEGALRQTTMTAQMKPTGSPIA